MTSVYEKTETFASGRWFGVRVDRSREETDAFEIAVGRGFEGSGTWDVLPVQVFCRCNAEQAARELFLNLVGHARQGDRRRDVRLA